MKEIKKNEKKVFAVKDSTDWWSKIEEKKQLEFICDLDDRLDPVSAALKWKGEFLNSSAAKAHKDIAVQVDELAETLNYVLSVGDEKGTIIDDGYFYSFTIEEDKIKFEYFISK